MSWRPDPATRAARAGLGLPRDAGGADLVAPPSLAAVRAYADLDALDAAEEAHQAYRREGSASVALLEAAVAELETPVDAETPLARATASGQAALGLAITLLATPGRRRVVVVRPCYGSTDALIAGPLGNLGVRMTTVDLPPGGDIDHAAVVADALGEDVAAVVAEVITNPLVNVIDVPAIASACHQAGVPCVVDATFATPFLFQPFAHGADLVVHSLTKHLSGHSDVLGGMLLVRSDHPAADWLDGFARLGGAVLSPFDAWLALRGLRTAALRIERATQNAAALAEWFAGVEPIAGVHYPGRHGTRDAERASRLLPRGRGPMLSIDLAGGRTAADALIRNLSGVRLAPSLGDVATTVSYPAITSHRTLTPQQRAALGIGDGLVRISAGIEHADDLKAEFGAALGATM